MSARDIATDPSSKAALRGMSDNRLQFNIDWITRPVFGALLAGLAIGATVLGGIAFVLFICIGAGAAVREWHRLFARGDFLLPTFFTIVAMIAALLWQLYAVPVFGNLAQVVSFAFLLIGCVANLFLGLLRKESPVAHATGALYLGLPTVALLMLRQSAMHPVWLVILLLLAVWATDTGALFSGNLIGGPKLAPKLSPNKTWAGSIGGLLCAALIAAILAAILKTSVLASVGFAAMVSVAGQIGDLFESMVKRHRGHKDSGGLIPGHGGVLDRIDSILFAAPCAAILVLVIGFNPLPGLQP